MAAGKGLDNGLSQMNSLAAHRIILAVACWLHVTCACFGICVLLYTVQVRDRHSFALTACSAACHQEAESLSLHAGRASYLWM